MNYLDVKIRPVIQLLGTWSLHHVLIHPRKATIIHLVTKYWNFEELL